MIVSLMGNRTGSAHEAPKARPAPVAHPAAPQAPAGAAPQALFDANGDGVIENWSVLHGGDSFTTLDPPPTGYDPVPPHPASDSPAPAATLHVEQTTHTGRAGTPAAVHHAHDAYQRDGLAGAPPGPVAAPADTRAAPAPAVAVAQPPVAQLPVVAHLPSTG